MINNRIRRKAWGKMEYLLDQNTPPSRSTHQRSSRWLWLLVLLMGSVGALVTVRLHQANLELRNQNASLVEQTEILQGDLKTLRQDHEIILAATNTNYHSSVSELNSTIARKDKDISRLSATIQQLRQQSVLSSSQMVAATALQSLEASTQLDQKISAFGPIQPLSRPMEMSVIQESTAPTINNSIEYNSVVQSSSFKPSIFGVGGITSAPRRGAPGGAVEIGVNFFPSSRWSLISDIGLMTLKTSIINQTAAAKAGFEAGLSRSQLAKEVEEEASRYTDYSFATASIGAVYRLSPKIILLSKVKASYILGSADFSQAYVQENGGSFVSVRESLSGLVRDNQLNRWGFSGVIGAEYELTDKLGLQLAFNKFLTPLVSQLPLGDATADNHLNDFTKVGVSYNF